MRVDNRRRSARETFAHCPYRYASEYVWGVDMNSTPARRGTTFHKARELYIRGLWQERAKADHEIAASALFEANRTLSLPHAARLDLESLWSRWIERFELNLDTFVEVESGKMSHFGAELRLDEVHAIGDTLRIVDAKTHWRIPSQSEADESFQAAFYLAGARRLFPGFDRYELVYDYVRYGVPLKVSHGHAEMDLTDAICEEQEAAMRDAEESGLFPAQGGAHCATCLAACPIVESTDRAPVRVTSDQEAKRMVGELAAFYRAEEVRQAALRAWADEHGPVESHGISWAHRPVERHTYPARAVLAVLDAHGVDFTPMLSASAVKPLLTSKRKYIAVQAEIQATAVTKVQTRFGPKVERLDDEREYTDEE